VWWQRVEKFEWERNTLHVIKALVSAAPPGSVVLDLGAWIGITPLFAAAAGANVYAFEPDRRAYSELVVNVAANPALDARISVHDTCIAAAGGNTPLYGFPGDGTGSIMPSMASKDAAAAGHVTCETLAAATARLGIVPTAVSLLKMDVEGAEAELLPAAFDWLRDAGWPPVWLSLHSFAWAPEQAASVRVALLAVAHKYKWVYTTDLVRHAATWLEAGMLADTSTLLLANVELNFE